jgi:tetratricopeptide (TPR) repeat protein
MGTVSRLSARWLPGATLGAACWLSSGGAQASPSADELLREAHVHEGAREDDLALRRYAEALALDPTLGDAYLGLAAVRIRLGDVREAVHVFDAALSHLPDLAAARLGRAHAQRVLGALREADLDLEAYAAATDDPAALRELAGWYAEEGRPLAQLAAWRRLLERAERDDGDAPLRREARLTVHALEVIVGTADPVRAPPDEPHASAVRRAMARIEARR